MPQQLNVSIENNFTKGLMTDFTGLNFPENAATDCLNTEFTLVGDVIRREGFDYELNYQLNTIDKSSKAINTYKWNNVGGDGNTQLIVQQTGTTLYFYSVTAATISLPLSRQKLASTVDISSFVAAGSTFDATIEAQFSDGNGFLFVYHPSCDPFYCQYVTGTLTAKVINLQIRDFGGIPEPTVPNNFRPLTLSNEHKYNLINQGWVSGNPWSASSSSTVATGTGARTFTVATGLTGITAGQTVVIKAFVIVGLPTGNPFYTATATVTSYTTGTGALVVSVSSFSNPGGLSSYGPPNFGWTIVPITLGYINTWFTAVGNYPSNADQWWNFKDTTDVFNPTTTLANTTIGTGPAPGGSIILDAFRQQRGTASGITGLTDVTTTARPRTGCWFAGRVWYTGIDSQQAATGDASAYSWTENIYFSQIVTDAAQFGLCYQTNDPTSETLFDLLPTDGGVIQIQGCGSIYKLFPIQNGLLVFAANGVWFITGSSGIGFTATDYAEPKLSAIQSISSTSFVDVQGLPYFWNEEGIYAVSPSQNGGLQVQSVSVGVIGNFYEDIPVQSKKYVRGVYHPIDYVIQWIYRTTNETSIANRYDFDGVLNFNTYSKAFFPYVLPDISQRPHVHGINYVAGPGGSTSPDPVFKYLTSKYDGTFHFTFSEENNVNYKDFVTDNAAGNDYESYFLTGFKLHGQGQRRFQLGYLYCYSRNDFPTAYKVQGFWDYANSGNSGRWSTSQAIINQANFGMVARRHRIRGQGLVLQIKISSISGQPFDIMGWSAWENVNTGQ